MADQSSPLDWRGTVPVSSRFDDPYYALEDGLAETRHVFLQGNDLPERFRDGFRIAELGFGTGLNLLAALHLWRHSGQTGVLHVTSFEAFPLSGPDMAQAQAAFPELSPIARELAPFWADNAHQITLEDLHFNLVPGDARQTVPRWTGQADAWFLDGFSPAKNPEMWTPELMQAVADHMAPDGTAATYTAAGNVRRALSDAGLDVQRVKGHGRKRHMTRARRL